MEALLQAIRAGEWHDIDVAVRAMAEGSTGISEADLHQILDLLPAVRRRFPERVSMPRDPVSWCRYEHIIWELGELFRHVLKRQRALRKKDSLFQPIERICRDPSFGKGRESFTMLLGQYGGSARAPVLIGLLDDPEVQGHAVAALRRLKVVEAKERIRPFLSAQKTWVRREAKKYFKAIDEG